MNELALSIRDALLAVNKEELINRVKAWEDKERKFATGGVVQSETNGDNIPAFLGMSHPFVSSWEEAIPENVVLSYEDGAVYSIRPGRYSRPKGFAKAFLIVTEDGNLFYENKKGVLKKLTPNAFRTHWDKGMNSLIESD